MSKIVVYIIQGCTKSHKIKTFLNQNDFQFEEVNITEDPARAEEVTRLVGEFYVPVLLYKNDTVIKGDDLEAIERLIQF